MLAVRIGVHDVALQRELAQVAVGRVQGDLQAHAVQVVQDAAGEVLGAATVRLLG